MRELKGSAPRISRRLFLKSVLASSAVYGLGCGSGSSSGSGAVGNGPFDVAIVGAGLAGLTAANALIANGKKVVVIEARNRVGGRAYSVNSGFAIPVDVGAQWFHQGLANPLIDLAISRGAPAVPDIYPRTLYSGSTLIDPVTDPGAQAAIAMFGAMETAATTAGEAIATGAQADESFGAVMTAAGLTGQHWFNWASNPLNRGLSMNQYSTLDYYDFSSLTLTPVGFGTGEEYLVPSGMGNFVAGFANGVPIKLNTPVSAIDYSGNGVQLTTPAGTVTAGTAIVTLPIPLLAAQTVSFNPPLPRSYLSALAGFVASVVDKVLLQYNGPVFGDVAINTFVSQLVDQAGGGLAMVNLYGQNVGEVIVMYPTAGELEAEGSDALVNFAAGIVNTAFPNAVPATVVNAMVNPWGTDPWAMCSWVEAMPGAVQGRISLATPINNRIFLAGEALSLNSCGSLLGAYQSGQAAAELACLALGSSANRELGRDDILAAFDRLGAAPRGRAKA